MREYEKHPHVRGEDCAIRLSFLHQVETPPRAWGRLIRDVADSWNAGNTPTCVGKTDVEASDGEHFWKHPHVRGEDCPQLRI